MMEHYEVEVEFSDGSLVTVEVEAENEHDALNKAMPISFRISG